MHSLAENLGCFVSDLDAMGYAELLNWSRYFKEKSEQADKPAETDWSNPSTIAEVFKL